MVDRLKTNLFLEKGDVCAGTDVVETVVVGTVGVVGAVDVVAAPLLILFSCTLVLLGIVGVSIKNYLSVKNVEMPKLKL